MLHQAEIFLVRLHIAIISDCLAEDDALEHVSYM